MQGRQKRQTCAGRPDGRERDAIEEFLAFIEERVKDIDPACADLVRLARLSLADPDGPRRKGRTLH